MLSALRILNLADERGLHAEVEAADRALVRLAQTASIPDAPLPLPPAQDRVTRLEHAYNRLATIVNQLKKRLDELDQGQSQGPVAPDATMDIGGLPQVEMVPGNVPEMNVTV